MLTQELKYLIVDPEEKPVAAYPDLATAEIDAEDLSKSYPDQLVHVFEIESKTRFDLNEEVGIHNYVQITYKHFCSYPKPPEPEEEGVEVAKETGAEPEPEPPEAAEGTEAKEGPVQKQPPKKPVGEGESGEAVVTGKVEPTTEAEQVVQPEPPAPADDLVKEAPPKERAEESAEESAAESEEKKTEAGTETIEEWVPDEQRSEEEGAKTEGKASKSEE